MKMLTTLTIGLGVFALAPLAAAQGLDCDTLTSSDFPELDINNLSASLVAADDEFARDHCRLTASTGHHTGVDGEDYAIRFELRLPTDWNRGFVHQFNGGNDGSVVPAVGGLLGGDGSDTALARGYAVVSSDAGHDGEAHPEAGLAGSARFGMDPQARRDYGYEAVATLNPLAEALIEHYYGDAINVTYGVGGSNGGRHAMVAASRMPEAFDGLLVGYPGFNLPKSAIQHAWDIQALTAINGDVRTALSREDTALVRDEILAQCDDLDGLADGWVADTDACQAQFDPDVLTCQAGQTDHCLAPEQVAALKAMHQGPHNSQGVPLYSDWPWDTGIATEDWRFWKIETPIPPWNNKPLIGVMGAASLAQLFTTPPTPVEGSPQALEEYLLSFDFDRDAPMIHATTETFQESAMEYMTPPGADNPELAEFRDAGGKILIFHGVSDPVFSVNDTTRWYQRLDTNNNGNAEAFARYYRIPGMPHGAGGFAPDDFDFFSALENWVDNDATPGAITARVSDENEEALELLNAVSRQLCPYPTVARYESGDVASAESFNCRR